MKNKKMKVTALIICALVIAAAVIAAVRYNQRRGAKTDYTPVKVERGDMKVTVATTGTVKPQNRVEIKPPISGRIEEIFFDEGAAVRKGQILGYLSSTDRAALLDAARAKGKDELARWEQLYKPMPIVAPVDGVIIARNVEPGQTVTANEKMLVMSDRLIVQAQVDETDIGGIKRGQATELNLDAYPANSITGIVDQIAHEALIVNNVTMYMVDILPDNVPPFMRSGMTANIQVITATLTNVLMLPTSAVQIEGKRASVRQPDPENSAKPLRTKVKTGLSDGKKIEILDGLKEGDTVLTISTRLPAAKQAATSPFSPIRPRSR